MKHARFDTSFDLTILSFLHIHYIIAKVILLRIVQEIANDQESNNLSTIYHHNSVCKEVVYLVPSIYARYYDFFLKDII